MCCSVLQRVAVRCRVLQCADSLRVADEVCCSDVLQCVAVVAVCYSGLHCVALCCIVLQCVAVCCSVMRSVAVCCSVWQCRLMRHTKFHARMYTQKCARALC